MSSNPVDRTALAGQLTNNVTPPPEGRVLVASTPEEGEIHEHPPFLHPSALVVQPGITGGAAPSATGPATPPSVLPRGTHGLLGWAATRVATPAQSSPTARAIRDRRASRRNRRAPYASSSPAVSFPSASQSSTGRGRRGGNDENTPPYAGPANASAGGSPDLWNQVGSTPPVDAMRTPFRDALNTGGLAPIPEDYGDVPDELGAATVTDHENELPGKHPNPPRTVDNPADLRKRAWMGSPTAELGSKGFSKRVRAAFQNGREPRPELGDGALENPWALDGGNNSITHRFLFANVPPVATSTPILHAASTSMIPKLPLDDNFFLEN
ncbi:hypothetical protein OH76DRAFT_1482942 [Lentinus brumalis]|uniref:Uncharacterized protein n=1 Tax=Lentinus brumalis TaxID=2498619 RepID=A0A371DAK9_9APHY|nr:hypothetical protein OH76DRAFT_1482942 [Polyporus brumalis]